VLFPAFRSAEPALFAGLRLEMKRGSRGWGRRTTRRSCHPQRRPTRQDAKPWQLRLARFAAADPQKARDLRYERRSHRCGRQVIRRTLQGAATQKRTLGDLDLLRRGTLMGSARIAMQSRFGFVWATARPIVLVACILVPVIRGDGKPQAIRVLKVSDGITFRMGAVTAYRIVHPDMGAKKLTLNYSTSEPGHEFAQHVHDNSDDTFLVLQGQMDVRHGDSRRPVRAGQAVFVPAGQVHGTITTGPGTVSISFQCPPDFSCTQEPAILHGQAPRHRRGRSHLERSRSWTLPIAMGSSPFLRWDRSGERSRIASCGQRSLSTAWSTRAESNWCSYGRGR